MIIPRLAATLALLFVAACASDDYVAEVEARYPPVGEFLEVKGLSIHYLDVGEGPAVILIHGANSNIRDWTFAMVDRLKDRHRVIAFDRPGLGYSERAADGGESPREQADVLNAAAKSLGVDSAVIVGHSFGGAVGAAWTVYHPETVAAFVSLAGATHDWGGDGGLIYGMGASDAFGGMTGAAARWYVSGDRAKSLINDVFNPNEPIPGYAEHLGLELALRPETFRNNSRDLQLLAGHLAEQSALYPLIEAPVVIIHGDADRTVGLEAHAIPMMRETPTAALRVLPGVGHMIHQVSQDEIVESIELLTYPDQ